MDSESEMLFNQLKESGFEILVEEFSEEIITAKKLAESLRKTMPNLHHMYDEPSNVFSPFKIGVNNNEWFTLVNS